MPCHTRNTMACRRFLTGASAQPRSRRGNICVSIAGRAVVGRHSLSIMSQVSSWVLGVRGLSCVHGVQVLLLLLLHGGASRLGFNLVPVFLEVWVLMTLRPLPGFSRQITHILLSMLFRTCWAVAALFAPFKALSTSRYSSRRWSTFPGRVRAVLVSSAQREYQ